MTLKEITRGLLYEGVSNDDINHAIDGHKYVVINYSNFDTDVSFHAGNRADNDARTTALARSMYNKDNEYSASLVDTSMNVAEGQYKTY